MVRPIADGADAVAVIGENRKMVVFPLAELPEMGRGQGVTLQRYRDGGLADAIAFAFAEGLSWAMGGETGRIRTETDMTPWRTARGAAGRMPPSASRAATASIRTRSQPRLTTPIRAKRYFELTPLLHSGGMQAAASRTPASSRRRRTDNPRAVVRLPAVDDTGLLEALPIAAAIFSSRNGKLWVDAANVRFLELAGCEGAASSFVEIFKRYADGPGGTLVREFLANPSSAPDEIEYAEGEGLVDGSSSSSSLR